MYEDPTLHKLTPLVYMSMYQNIFFKNRHRVNDKSHGYGNFTITFCPLFEVHMNPKIIMNLEVCSTYEDTTKVNISQRMSS